MINKAPVLTDAGAAMLARALNGETLTFTKFKIGNGTPTDTGKSLTDLVSAKLSFGITEIDAGTAKFVTVTGAFDSSMITETFQWTELGIFATIGTDEEKLYGYIYDSTAGNLSPQTGDVIAQQTVEMIIGISDASSVTATITPGTVYASKEAFDEHTADTGNPHGVTAEQVGLGNVANVSTNNQTPTYSVATENANLASGEKISTAFGKIAKAVQSLISHIANKSNPHEVTAEQVGLGDVSTDITTLKSHLTDYSNPHKVSASQIGLVDYVTDYSRTKDGLGNVIEIKRWQNSLGNKTEVQLKKKNVTASEQGTCSGGVQYVYYDIFKFSLPSTVTFDAIDTCYASVDCIGNGSSSEGEASFYTIGSVWCEKSRYADDYDTVVVQGLRDASSDCAVDLSIFVSGTEATE